MSANYPATPANLTPDFPASTRMPLVRDTSLAWKIAVMLIVKACFLFVIWKLWFSQPQTVGMRLPTGVVEERLLGAEEQ